MADPVGGGCGGCNPPPSFKKNSGHPRGHCDSDRVFQNESRDSKAVLCVRLHRRCVRYNANYVRNAQIPVCPFCSRCLPIHL